MKLLIVEDDPGLQSQLRWCFPDHQVFHAEDQEGAVKILEREHPEVVTLDLGLPPDPGGVSVGFELLQQIVDFDPGIKIVVITGQEGREHAMNAIKLGAYDFFQKPIDAKILSLVVDRANYLRQLEQEIKSLKRDSSDSPLNGFITSDPSVLEICKTIEKVAPSDLSVLVTGESGTGKEIIARSVHELSSHSGGRFVAINCAAIPENLLESELFGHEKGSFTGATSQKKGKVELANGGTLFLDEIGDMPAELQSKLLRFLQERVVERVGGTQEIPVDIRVVCATHQPLKEMIQANRFREDLYFRLSDITIELPPLRDRGDDILLLAQVFLEREAANQGKSINGLSPDAERTLLDYECKGNVRELEKIIRRAVILADGQLIKVEDLLLEGVSRESGEAEVDDGADLNLAQARNMVEKRVINKALKRAEGNLSMAAKLLDVTRPTLYSLLKRLEIDPETL